MFDMLKQMGALKGIQDSLSGEKIELERKGVKVVIKGSMEIEQIVINPILEKEEQERILKELINDANKKMQKIAFERMMKTPGLGFKK